MKQNKTSTLKKVMHYAQPYKDKMFWVVLTVITLAVFGAIRPYMVKNVVDVYISYLRNKIEKNNSKYIHTVKGVGYMFKL